MVLSEELGEINQRIYMTALQTYASETYHSDISG